MKRKLALAAFLLLVLVALAALWLWYVMGKPLYEPGMVRAGANLRASLEPPAQAGEADFWNVEDDIKLHHFSDGAGKSVLVVHGGPGFPFRRPAAGLKPLTDNCKFIYYDQRGCGRSTRPIDRFASSNFFENMKAADRLLGLGAQIADIERIRRILGEEKLVLLGHSFGGFLASLYAAEFPERVRGLILVAPADVLVMPVEGGGLFGVVRGLLPEGRKNEYDQFLKGYLDFSNIFSKSDADLTRLNAEFASYYGAAAKARGLWVPEESDSSQGGGWMVQAMYLSMGKRHDYRAALGKVQAPVLVIHGENDLQPEKASRAYADCFASSSFRQIKNSGHFPFSEQPEQFATVVGKFLEALN